MQFENDHMICIICLDIMNICKYREFSCGHKTCIDCHEKYRSLNPQKEIKYIKKYRRARVNPINQQNQEYVICKINQSEHNCVICRQIVTFKDKKISDLILSDDVHFSKMKQIQRAQSIDRFQGSHNIQYDNSTIKVNNQKIGNLNIIKTIGLVQNDYFIYRKNKSNRQILKQLNPNLINNDEKIMFEQIFTKQKKL